jgi:predicted transcriptional regulator
VNHAIRKTRKKSLENIGARIDPELRQKLEAIAARAALDDVISFRTAVEHSVKTQVTELRRIERIRAAALLN